jgi:uncharacterized protein involved in exopolysaccharide biosynthesis
MEMIRRRLPSGLLVFALFLLVALGLALGLPAIYKSRAVVLIEAQEIPQDMVRSMVTSFADQRLQVISQRVLTNSNLGEIIQKFDLYQAERKKNPLEVVLQKMRKDIIVAPISADVVDPKQGKAVQATIAFEMSYQNRSPEIAQRVANEIVSLLLNENLKQRTETSTDTLGFLSAEAEKLGATVSELEQRLASFKKTNSESLPELSSLNLELMNRSEADISALDGQLRSLDQQRVYLESELAQQKPVTQLVSETGERILGPADRLKVLESEFVPLAARYGDKHPDVMAKRREIESLKAQVGAGNSGSELALRLQRVQADYGETLKKYSPDHPDVKRLARQVDSLQAELAKAGRSAPAVASGASPDNPAYIQLKARLDATAGDIASLQSQRATLKAKIANLEQRITSAPETEREYRGLARDYEIAQRKYQEVLAKKQEAELANNLESKQRGERFSLIEPPMIPEQPAKPNRMMIGLLGLFLSLGAGVGAGALLESIDSRIYGRAGVVRLLGVPPLAVIPVLDTEETENKKRSRWLVAAASVVLVLIAAAVVIHLVLIPLDVLFFRVLRVLGA